MFRDEHGNENFRMDYGRKLIDAVKKANSTSEFELLHSHGWVHLTNRHWQYPQFKTKLTKFAKLLRDRVGADEVEALDKIINSEPATKESEESFAAEVEALDKIFNSEPATNENFAVRN